jgi:microcystin-dependent protein
MPSDANGVHTLPAGYLAETGETILASQHNPPLEDLSASMSLRLMRSGVAPMTGPLKAVDGTVSAPGLTFASAPSSGVYPTADGLGVSIGGVKVAEFTSAGLKSGVRFIGELIEYTGSTAPALTVFPVGQTLSRTTYADLWTFAQLEIAAGNTLYNNGNGSTTFGIPDKRGRVSATKDNLGGSAASRLTGTTMTPDGNTLGAVSANNQTVTLAANQIPSLTSSGSNSITVTGPVGAPAVVNASIVSDPGTGGGGNHWSGGSSSSALSFVGTNPITVAYTNASQQAVANVQPTLITTCLLYAGA